MKFIIFDTETTSLPKFRGLPESSCLDKFNDRFVKGRPMIFRGEPIQVGGLVCDEELNILDIISFYCMPSEPISEEAFKVNGISNELIYRLAGGKTLEHYLGDVYEDLFYNSNNVYIGHNVTFDMKCVNNTLLDYCNPPVNFGDKTTRLYGLDDSKSYYYDTMSSARSLLHLPKNPKLIDIVHSLRPDLDLDHLAKVLLSKYHKSASVKFHDAVFDSICTWVVAYELRKLG